MNQSWVMIFKLQNRISMIDGKDGLDAASLNLMNSRGRI